MASTKSALAGGRVEAPPARKCKPVTGANTNTCIVCGLDVEEAFAVSLYVCVGKSEQVRVMHEACVVAFLEKIVPTQ